MQLLVTGVLACRRVAHTHLLGGPQIQFCHSCSQHKVNAAQVWRHHIKNALPLLVRCCAAARSSRAAERDPKTLHLLLQHVQQPPIQKSTVSKQLPLHPHGLLASHFAGWPCISIHVPYSSQQPAVGLCVVAWTFTDPGCTAKRYDATHDAQAMFRRLGNDTKRCHACWQLLATMCSCAYCSCCPPDWTAALPMLDAVPHIPPNPHNAHLMALVTSAMACISHSSSRFCWGACALSMM